MNAKPKAAAPAADARSRAVRLLTELAAGRRHLDALLADEEAGAALPSGKERDLFHALVFGVLRWQGRLDHILSAFSRIPLQKIDPPVLIILRVGLFQLAHLDRIPPSAAVNTAVAMAKAGASPWAASFVNAVLRKAAAEHAGVAFPDAAAAPVEALAAAGSFPPWLARRWLARYGWRAAPQLVESINTIAPLTLRANTLLTTREALRAALAPQAERVAVGCAAPDALVVSGLRGRLTELAAFKKGWFQVQDEAAQLTTLLLAPLPGERVLDACAGRGNKTAHLAQLMENRGSITAVDKSSARLQQLEAEIPRLGVLGVTMQRLDWERGEPARTGGPFDRVLLDAPCSGLGTLRRNPDIKWRATEEGLKRHHGIQLCLLARTAACLKPGGVLVYAVCSPEPEETEAVIEGFLAQNPGWQIDEELTGVPQAVRRLVVAGGVLSTYPHLTAMDGFFAVRLKRRG